MYEYFNMLIIGRTFRLIHASASLGWLTKVRPRVAITQSGKRIRLFDQAVSSLEPYNNTEDK